MNKQNKGKNKKMIVLIIVVCAVVVAVGVYLVRAYLKSHILDGPGMVNDVSVTSIDFQVYPDEYGQSSSISFKAGSIKYYKSTVSEDVKESCSAGNDIYDDLESIFRKYGVKYWTDLPKSEIEVLDASTEFMRITFADGTIISLGDDYEMPENGWKAVAEITDLLKKYVKEHQSSENSESSLTLLVDYCEKNTATVDGDGYSEIVLYKNEAESTFEIHTYVKQADMESEEQAVYSATQDTADAVLNLIAEQKLADYRDAQGTGLDGAEYVVKFKQGDETIRISTDNLGEDGAAILKSVGSLLRDAIAENKE